MNGYCVAWAVDKDKKFKLKAQIALAAESYARKFGCEITTIFVHPDELVSYVAATDGTLIVRPRSMGRRIFHVTNEMPDSSKLMNLFDNSKGVQS